MCARKFSQSDMGEWDTDDTGLPVVHLNVANHLPLSPLPSHIISTGRLGAAVDVLGRVMLIDQTGTFPEALKPAQSGSAGQFFFELVATNSCRRPLIIAAVHPAEDPGVEWGVGHATFSADLNLDGQTLQAAVRLLAPPQADYFLAELTLKNGSADPLQVDIKAIADLPVTPDEHTPPTVFKRESVIMFTEVDEKKRDFFIAAGAGWGVEAHGFRLNASRKASLAAGDEVVQTLLVGIRRECTVEWALQQLQSCQPDTILKEIAGPLDLTFPRFPEAWMKEECVWAVSRLLTGRLSPPQPDDAGNLDAPAITVRSVAGAGGAPDALRDLLRLALPLAYINPELARNNLTAVTGHLDAHGALSSVQPGSFRPEKDVCDLEIWLILGWCHLLALTGDDTMIDRLKIRNGSQVPLQQVLEKAYAWIESAIDTGAHGLIRSGAGDGTRLLAPMGRHGCGESTVATAQLIYALDLWSSLEPRLCDRPSAPFEQARLQIPALRRAVEDAFANGVFIRGYDDEGLAVGDAGLGGGWFADAQAWAILSKSGHSQQRGMAAKHLADAGDGLPIATVYPPFFPAASPAIAADCPLPGCGENGGIDAFVWACAVWAMAESHLREEALQQWTSFSLRQMMRAHQLAPFLPADAEGRLPSHQLPCQWRYPGFTGSKQLPDAGWLSWHHFALSKILS